VVVEYVYPRRNAYSHANTDPDTDAHPNSNPNTDSHASAGFRSPGPASSAGSGIGYGFDLRPGDGGYSRIGVEGSGGGGVTVKLPQGEKRNFGI